MVNVQVGEQDVFNVQLLTFYELVHHLALGITHHARVNDHGIMCLFVPQDVHILAKHVDGHHCRIHFSCHL